MIDIILRAIFLCFIAAVGSSQAVAASVTLVYDNTAMAGVCKHAKQAYSQVICRQVDGGLSVKTEAVRQAMNVGPVIFDAMVANQAPDILQYIINLEPLLQREKRHRVEMVWQQTVQPFLPGGKQMMFTRWEVRSIFYNRTLFRSLGIAVPTAELTWDALAATIKKAYAGSNEATRTTMSTEGLGLINDELFAALSWSSDSHISPSNLQVQEDKGLSWALTWLRDIQEAGITVFGRPYVWSSFQQGRLPIAFGYLSYAAQPLGSLDWSVTPMPYGPSGRRWVDITAVNDGSWSLADRTGNIQEGWELLLWMTCGEGAKYVSASNPLSITVPSLMGTAQVPRQLAARDVGDVLRSVGERYGRTEWDQNYLAQAYRVLYPDIESYGMGTTTLKTALGRIETKLREWFAQHPGK